MIKAIADTHAVIWYLFGDSRLSAVAYETIEKIAAEGNQVGFSAITLAEIVYLSERGRISAETLSRLIESLIQEGSVLVDVPFNREIAVVMQQVERTKVPELPDRMIAATALYLSVPVITRDHKIQASSLSTIW
ncbi:MAG: type II toxin-antitoxin system VapC family toxin [Leptolyngbyaceae cyanobacterium MO_188.B28]|nr:type II toxin-antitoxin system VapC family toxin [Leptolyngbyaceae cyanobacterium MO_188.B28]